MVELAGAIDEVVAVVTIDTEGVAVPCTGKTLAANTVLAGTLIDLTGTGVGEMMAAITICAGLSAILSAISTGLGGAIGTTADVGFTGAVIEVEPSLAISTALSPVLSAV